MALVGQGWMTDEGLLVAHLSVISLCLLSHKYKLEVFHFCGSRSAKRMFSLKVEGKVLSGNRAILITYFRRNCGACKDRRP
nr:hypothetical protein REQ54_04389 [Rhizobium sp. Q54]CAD6437955.1 hypothetical protein REQ54_04402 [Rhizobium sp. Q54]